MSTRDKIKVVHLALSMLGVPLGIKYARCTNIHTSKLH